jgi:DNA gyrase subunit A
VVGLQRIDEIEESQFPGEDSEDEAISTENGETPNTDENNSEQPAE